MRAGFCSSAIGQAQPVPWQPFSMICNKRALSVRLVDLRAAGVESRPTWHSCQKQYEFSSPSSQYSCSPLLASFWYSIRHPFGYMMRTMSSYPLTLPKQSTATLLDQSNGDLPATENFKQIRVA